MFRFKQTVQQATAWQVCASIFMALFVALALSACGGSGATDATGGYTAMSDTTGANESGTSSTSSTATSTATGTGTGTGTTTTAGNTAGGTGTGSTTTGGTGTTPTSPTSSTPPATPPISGGTVSAESYTITVYYTAVESFHTDAAQSVSGCLIRDCTFGNSLIGSYPASFIKATKDEGTGRITSGANAGKYLNWSSDVGYWLDTIASNGYGGALVPFQTAAADSNVLPQGAWFRLVAPLKLEDGSALDTASANRLLSAQWYVQDQFTPGLGGANHLDLYLGEEDRVNFTSSSLYTTLAGVKIARL